MNNPKFIVSDQKEDSSSIQMVMFSKSIGMLSLTITRMTRRYNLYSRPRTEYKSNFQMIIIMLGNFSCFCGRLTFFKIHLFKKIL